MSQTFQTSHLALNDIQNHNILAGDLVKLCIRLGEKYSTLGITTSIPKSSVTSLLQLKLFIPLSPLSHA